jgi:hypothetical protein
MNREICQKCSCVVDTEFLYYDTYSTKTSQPLRCYFLRCIGRRGCVVCNTPIENSIAKRIDIKLIKQNIKDMPEFKLIEPSKECPYYCEQIIIQ